VRKIPVLLSLLLVTACQHRQVLGSITDADSMRAAIIALAPVGSPAGPATPRLADQGFTCSPRHGTFGGHAPSDYLYCTASFSAGLPVNRVWHVAVFTDSGRVVGAAAATGLLAP